MPDFSVVSALGDSLTAPSPWPTYANLIAPQLGPSMLNNLAVGGTTSSTLLLYGQHTRAVQQYGTTFAFLWIGGNDMLGAWMSGHLSQPGDTGWINQYETNLATALDTLLTGGSDVIIANLMDFNEETGFPRGQSVPPRQAATMRANMEAYTSRLQAVADARGVPVVDMFDEWASMLVDPPSAYGVPVTNTVGDPLLGHLWADDIHPNGLGHRIIANLFIETMNQHWGLSLAPVPLPEPLSLALMGMGAAWLLRRTKR